MKLFLDTSVLVKKYIVEEQGAARLAALLAKASTVIVSPVTWIETHHAFYRIKREGLLDVSSLKTVFKMLKEDYTFFHVVAWNSALEEIAVKILEEFPLRSQDSIQLAAAVTSAADVFCAADRKLYLAARKYFRTIEFIE
ncbi:MAG: type II toxin-antitoxin system VapC family toxin [Candidatus Omnitrophica bacterium]|nr:type II toxin-antitoxin system VapC family toxin [Candidatus Omnitrophota bacterium]